MNARALVAAGLLLAACNDGPTRVALPCDVRTRACQRSVFEATAETRRQRGARLPPVRIITRARLAQEYRDELERADEQPENEEDRALRLMQQGLAQLGLLPSDQSFDEAYVDQAVDSIAAYYSSRSKSITIIADSAEDEDEATFTLSHEYVHALQDQREGLGALHDHYSGSSDDENAITALVEGEATWLSIVTYRGAARGEAPAEIDAPTIFRSSLEATLEDIESASAPLINASELLPYPLGGAGVARRYLQRGASGVESLYAAPPHTLLAWVDAPSLRRVALAELPEALDCDTPEPAEGFEMGLEDRLGFAGLLAFGVAIGQSAEDAFDTASDWRADRVTSYGTDDDASANAIAWRIRLGSASAAEALALAVTQGPLAITAVARDQEVLVAAASDPALLESWPDADACPAQEKSRRQPARSVLAALHRRLGIVR